MNGAHSTATIQNWLPRVNNLLSTNTNILDGPLVIPTSFGLLELRLKSHHGPTAWLKWFDDRMTLSQRGRLNKLQIRSVMLAKIVD